MKTILITGAAGYIGGMLADQFSNASDLERVIAIDKNSMPEILRGNKKIMWITTELSDGAWQDKIRIFKPEVVIHAAWQIKELYRQKERQRKLNIEASRRVFEFAFREASVKKLVYFSTISAYGAFAANDLDKRFNESSPLYEDEYLYGVEKKEAEQILENLYKQSHGLKQVTALRLTSVTGPRGRYGAGKRGLLYMLKNILPVFPVASTNWCRQYVHEDDLTDVVALFAFNNRNEARGYSVFIIAPNDYVLAKEMARVFKKMILRVPAVLVRWAFFIAWHLTRGKIPTGRGAWKFFCYPIPVDGSKITEEVGYEYSYSSIEALSRDEGRYGEDVKIENRK